MKTTERHHVRTIIVVDDNVDAASSLGMLLKLDGHAVQTATTGVRALELAQISPPDLFIIDLGMPRMDGFEVARRIRAEQWGSRTMLIAMTGWSREEDIEQSLNAGFNYHLVKPVEIDALRSLIANHSWPATPVLQAFESPGASAG